MIRDCLKTNRSLSKIHMDLCTVRVSTFFHEPNFKPTVSTNVLDRFLKKYSVREQVDGRAVAMEKYF
jgi:hypothetical protein